MKPRLLRSSKRQKPDVCSPLGRQRPNLLPWSRRQKPIMPSKPTCWNNPMRKVCLSLECEALVEEGCDCQVFMEACSATWWACPLNAHGVLIYPLQLLTGNVLLAAMLATTPQSTTVARQLLPAASPPTVSRIPAPPTGTKQWHQSSDQEATPPRPEEEEAAILDVTLEEHPHQRWKEGRPLARLLNENHQEAFKKTLILSKLLGMFISKCTSPTMMTRGPRTSPTPSRRWPPLLASYFLKSMRSRSCGLDEKTSGLLTMWQRFPQRASSFSWWCLPPNHLRSWDWRGSIPPKPFAGKQDCPTVVWKRKVEIKGTVVNHLWMSHYHLGLICSQCLNYSTSSANAIQCH